MKSREKSTIIFIGQTSVLKQRQPLEVMNTASFSTIISGASFLCYAVNNVNPPGCPKTDKNIKDQCFPSHNLSFNYYMEPWTDYLANLSKNMDENEGYIFQKDQITYFVSKVTDQYLNSMVSQNQEVENNVLDKYFELNKNLSNQQIQQIQKLYPLNTNIHRRFGLINFAASQLRTDPYRPKCNLEGLMLGFWRREGDKWDRYDILKGNYPTAEDFAQTDTFILSGSHFSVNDNQECVTTFMTLLKDALIKNPKLKVLGLCFGHQAICKYYGGEVVKKPLYAGLQSIKIQKDTLQKFQFLHQLEQSEILYLSEYHSDYADILPNGFQNFAFSESCSNQAMVSNDGRLLSFQYHAEYTNLYTRSYQMRVKKYYPNDPLKDFAGPDRPQFKTNEALEKIQRDCFQMRSVVRNFLEWSPQ